MIERINPFGLSIPPGYSQVVVASESWLVTTAGVVPLDAAGNLVGTGDHLAQARQTLDNLELVLEAAGATGRDIVKTMLYVVAEGRADPTAVWEVAQESGGRRARRGEHLPGRLPARLQGTARRDRSNRRVGVAPRRQVNRCGGPAYSYG